LSAKQAAKRLGLSQPTIYRLAGRGELPAVRVGDAVRFDPADLARFVEGKKAEARP
jgi:excisionase family DNA binding protein